VPILEQKMELNTVRRHNYKGDQVVESCCAHLTTLGECTGVISIMDHTHFRDNER